MSHDKDATDGMGGRRLSASTFRLIHADDTVDLLDLVAMRAGRVGAFLDAVSRPGTPEFERVWQGMVDLGYDPAQLIHDVQVLGEAAAGRFPIPAGPARLVDITATVDPAGSGPVAGARPGPDREADPITGDDRGHFVLGVQTSSGPPVPRRTEPSGLPLEESFSSDAGQSDSFRSTGRPRKPCAFQFAVELARAGKRPPRVEKLWSPSRKVTEAVRLLASVMWHLAGRRVGNKFSLGLEQTAKLLGRSEATVSGYLHRLEDAGVIRCLKRGNNLTHKVSKFEFFGVRPS